MSLLSVKKISKMDEYKIIFDDVDVFLCNKVQGWRIRLAKVQCGLYYLSHTTLSPHGETKFKIATVNNTYTKNAIILLHKRLGHPSFILLQNMYPSLFK